MTTEVLVPDIGDFDTVDVIEILVKPGDEVSLETPLITLESDKATMEIPSPVAGRVVRVITQLGDKVGMGAPIVEVEPITAPASAPEPANRAQGALPPEAERSGASLERPVAAKEAAAQEPAAAHRAPAALPQEGTGRQASPEATEPLARHLYASPAMRKLGRELGVDLSQVKGTGRKGRIQREDIIAHVKQAMTEARAPAAPGGFVLPELPAIDFSRFGDIETRPLTKIRRATGQNLHRSWITAPHVTQFDEADITELEAFRKAQGATAEAAGTKLTLLAFLVKAVTVALAHYPDFNASLSPDGEALVYKKYFHIGMAANTPRGLLVPVIRDANRKGLLDIAREVRELGQKARDAKLSPADMQGGCFTISSLGGISGTGFTPIINVPEVAILGVSPAAMKPVWRNNAFEPRLMLPLSLSYDHRVIDGVAAAEFTRYLGLLLGDIRQILL